MSANEDRIARELLDRAGTTYAAEAGITLADKPAPLFQLLVLAQLMSARITADIAVAAARELRSSGYRTPQRVAEADWQDLVDALGRGHYRRYDESTATRLGENATILLDRYQGDLRKLAAEADRDPDRLTELLQQFKGIGPTGAEIFLREVQDVWTWVRPHFDDRARKGADLLHLSTDPKRLDRLGPSGHDAELAAALVRVSLDKDLADRVLAAAG
ncbi:MULTISPECIES: endonuclease [Nocardia]|uniref:endonuclease n=1 Tax=Nocardia TaxID=1817 RepID=UPI0004C2FC8A|nr:MULTISPECIES: endonuclease [Nocardia]MBF6143728.1 endonuclease [Nocardia nova]MDN2498702.1 endonuclease [Nocardia nova]PPJ00139.1 endonuclease [Nocardia nova]